MSIYKIVVAILTVGMVSSAIFAAPIAVTNYSFENPGVGKIKGWDGEGVAGTPAVDIPGWSSDSTPTDSGVETGWGASNGSYSGFLMGGDSSIFNLTGHTIAAGEEFTLLVDAKNGDKLTLTLYYDDGTRVEGASLAVVTVTGGPGGALTEYSLGFAADDVPASIGNKIGIEIDNDNSWMQFDNVRLDVIPEPATMSLLGLGGLALLRRKRK